MAQVEDVTGVRSREALIRYLSASLRYEITDVSYQPGQLDIPPKPSESIRSIQLLSDYNRAFQIYLFETTSLTRTTIRSILEPFYRYHPAGDYLFIFTKDYTELALISPQRILRPDKRLPVLQLRILPVEPSNVYHTDLEVLRGISLTPADQYPEIIRKKHEDAFSVERVTNQFFDTYKRMLAKLESKLVAQHRGSAEQARGFAQQLLNRLMFLYFLQKKGWLKWGDGTPDKRYMRTLWQKYVATKPSDNAFYRLWLSSLFFYAFNRRSSLLPIDLPGEIRGSFLSMPFLNGGLFAESDSDRLGFDVPDDIFTTLFDTNIDGTSPGFLERYNFTIQESLPLEVEVAVDPEMLGRVYESLINEEDRHQSGIFYTPRIEIDYMCRLALIEYLHEATGFSKDMLIPLVMAPASEDGQKELNKLSNEELNRLRGSLDSVRVVDPAVGSGSFLVGMMNVLVQLYRAIAERSGRPENEFALKKQIISQNLYGVDVKDWAVRVCELRLWLSLIIESEESQMDIYNQPLLPNLTFKARQGDSLVEELAGMPLSLRGDYPSISPSIKQRIRHIVDKKADYFRGDRSVSRHEIEHLEHELLAEVLDSKIKTINSEIRALESPQRQAFQTGMEQIRGSFLKTEEIVKGLKEAQAKIQPQIDAKKAERERLQNVAASIGKRKEKDYFLWDIDFAEVFLEKGGFDICIGNPPYVRQEEIAPPLNKAEDYDPDEWRGRKKAYKEQLEGAIKAHWGSAVTKIDKKSDLYVYFYYQGLDLLRPGGVFCFINSNSWLDVGYGASLQEFLLRSIAVRQVIDNQARRSFKESDVNTIIVVLKRPLKDMELKDNEAKFIAYRQPFESAVNAENLLLQEWAKGIESGNEYRIYPITHKELWVDGIEEGEAPSLELGLEHGKYIGGKWGGKYLRAPDIFFTILEKAAKTCNPFGDFVRGQRYLNTGGADGFFIITRYRLRDRYYEIVNVSKEGREDGAPEFIVEAEFLRPAVKSTDLRHLVIAGTDALVLDIPPDTRGLRQKKAYMYIEWGERKGFNQRSVTKMQKPWWRAPLQARESGPILWMRNHDDTHKAFYNPQRFIAVRFYRFYPKRPDYERPLAAILNSTYYALLKEIYGSTKLGLGALDTTMEDMKRVPIPFPVNSDYQERLTSLFDEMSKREIKSVFEELGLPKPNRDYSNISLEDISLDKVLPDRRELDRVVFEALGLTEKEQLEVYRAVVELVKNRLTKARSV